MEEAPRKILSREPIAAQMGIVFRGVLCPCASRGYLGLLSRGEANIAFCQASAHCGGSVSLSPSLDKSHRRAFLVVPVPSPRSQIGKKAPGCAMGRFQYADPRVQVGILRHTSIRSITCTDATSIENTWEGYRFEPVLYRFSFTTWPRPSRVSFPLKWAASTRFDSSAFSPRCGAGPL